MLQDGWTHARDRLKTAEILTVAIPLPLTDAKFANIFRLLI